ncbi:MAG TPA: N-acetylmuramoyl-L-alanine amidase, partial [bacterium]|jgi:N-acetylmuramoyl-L-alanine amidase|nr:N-acetylmuramoyl-L-alanine amidase [bacterium]
MPRIEGFLTILAVAAIGFCFPAAGLKADESVSLKYTYKLDQGSVPVLHDMKGKVFLPLREVAQFYGVDLQFDSQTRRISLQKGKNQVKIVLSQSVFLILNPESSFSIDPVEVVSGQLAIPPESAGDIFGTLLNVNVRFLDDQQALVAGGVREDELRQEILAQAGQLKTPSAVPTSSAVVGVTQVAIPTAAPSLEPTPTEEAQAQEEPVPAGQSERIRRIVIDAGHGGNDAGAPGHDRRYHEKEATLDIAKRVADYLKEEPSDQGLEVLMTRHGDYYITLKYRTDFANSHDADLFVSIHCNSNPRTVAHGTEIYCYGSKASNKLAAVAAARENEEQGLSSLLDNLRTNVYKVRSHSLAEHVESSIREKLGQHFRNIQQAPFYVLAHADMPSILVETAFISNQEEENKLRDPYWRDKMAKAIAEGIISYKDLVEGTVENQQASR